MSDPDRNSLGSVPKGRLRPCQPRQSSNPTTSQGGLGLTELLVTLFVLIASFLLFIPYAQHVALHHSVQLPSPRPIAAWSQNQVQGRPGATAPSATRGRNIQSCTMNLSPFSDKGLGMCHEIRSDARNGRGWAICSERHKGGKGVTNGIFTWSLDEATPRLLKLDLSHAPSDFSPKTFDVQVQPTQTLLLFPSRTNTSHIHLFVHSSQHPTTLLFHSTIRVVVHQSPFVAGAGQVRSQEYAPSIAKISVVPHRQTIGSSGSKEVDGSASDMDPKMMSVEEEEENLKPLRGPDQEGDSRAGEIRVPDFYYSQSDAGGDEAVTQGQGLGRYGGRPSLIEYWNPFSASSSSKSSSSLQTDQPTSASRSIFKHISHVNASFEVFAIAKPPFGLSAPSSSVEVDEEGQSQKPSLGFKELKPLVWHGGGARAGHNASDPFVLLAWNGEKDARVWEFEQHWVMGRDANVAYLRVPSPPSPSPSTSTPTSPQVTRIKFRIPNFISLFSYTPLSLSDVFSKTMLRPLWKRFGGSFVSEVGASLWKETGGRGSTGTHKKEDGKKERGVTPEPPIFKKKGSLSAPGLEFTKVGKVGVEGGRAIGDVEETGEKEVGPARDRTPYSPLIDVTLDQLGRMWIAQYAEDDEETLIDAAYKDEDGKGASEKAQAQLIISQVTHVSRASRMALKPWDLDSLRTLRRSGLYLAKEHSATPIFSMPLPPPPPSFGEADQGGKGPGETQTEDSVETRGTLPYPISSLSVDHERRSLWIAGSGGVARCVIPAGIAEL